MKPWLWLILLLLLPLAVLKGWDTFVEAHVPEQIEKAEHQVELAAVATSVEERVSALNRALHLYKLVEQENDPNFGNGKLYYNLGNLYFQLQEYPLAVFYYARAKKLMPSDEKLAFNRAQVFKVLNLKPPSQPSFYEFFRFADSYLALPYRLQLFAYTVWVLFLFASFNSWFKETWMKRALFLTLTLTTLLFLSTVYSFFIAPLEGILVRSTFLYRDAGTQYAQVSERAFIPGTEVQVLEVIDEGKWLKVKGPDEQVGYLSHEVIRIIK